MGMHPQPWRKGEHSFEKGWQVLDSTGKEIAWIRYNENADVDAMVAAGEMAALMRKVRASADRFARYCCAVNMDDPILHTKGCWRGELDDVLDRIAK